MAERVNDAVIDAGTCPIDNWQLKTIHVVRWDAKRELLDSARNYIDETLRLKAEIVMDRRKEEVNQ